MRHLKAHRKLGRTSEHRMSMLRNLATSLVNARDERIVTTLPKAKELRPFVEKVITLSRQAHNLEGDKAKAGAVHLRRQAAAFFHAGNMAQTAANGRRGHVRAPRTAGVAALKRLFDELGERFADRPGGYTRIFKLGRRDGDNAELAIIELVDNPRELEAKENARKRAKSGTAGKKKSGKSDSATEGSKAGGKKASKRAAADKTSEAVAPEASSKEPEAAEQESSDDE
jgi:large subunit ribosomal protein L17